MQAKHRIHVSSSIRNDSGSIEPVGHTSTQRLHSWHNSSLCSDTLIAERWRSPSETNPLASMLPDTYIRIYMLPRYRLVMSSGVLTILPTTLRPNSRALLSSSLSGRPLPIGKSSHARARREHQAFSCTTKKFNKSINDVKPCLIIKMAGRL